MDRAMPGEAFQRSYDLYVKDGTGFRFRSKDRGVTLTDWRLGWTADGKPDGAPLQNIAQVRLLCGGDWRNPLNQCQISFADGHLLTLHDGTEYGSVDEARTPVYAEFVRALHARLAAAPAGTIKFIQGYPETNFYLVAAAAGLLGLIAVGGPIGLWIVTGQLQALLLLIGGAALCWPLYKMMQNNAPRRYDPRQLPAELLE